MPSTLPHPPARSKRRATPPPRRRFRVLRVHVTLTRVAVQSLTDARTAALSLGRAMTLAQVHAPYAASTLNRAASTTRLSATDTVSITCAIYCGTTAPSHSLYFSLSSLLHSSLVNCFIHCHSTRSTTSRRQVFASSASASQSRAGGGGGLTPHAPTYTFRSPLGTAISGANL